MFGLTNIGNETPDVEQINCDASSTAKRNETFAFISDEGNGPIRLTTNELQRNGRVGEESPGAQGGAKGGAKVGSGSGGSFFGGGSFVRCGGIVRGSGGFGFGFGFGSCRGSCGCSCCLRGGLS